MEKKYILHLTLLILIIGISSVSYAINFTVSPVTLNLSVRNPIGIITLLNSGENDSYYQVEAKKWQQYSGQDIYLPAKKFVVTPPVFKLPAHGKNTIRVGYNSGQNVIPIEISYRVIFKELPAVKTKVTEFTNIKPGLHFLHRISVPVFIAPTVPVKSSLKWQAKALKSNRISLLLYNKGNVHCKILKMIVKDKASGKIIFKPSWFYLLAQTSKDWQFKFATNFKPHQLTIVINSDLGRQDFLVPVIL